MTWRSSSILGQRRTSWITFYGAGATAQTDAPAGFQELFAGTNRRAQALLSGRRRMRVSSGGGVVGFAGSTLQVWASIDGGSTLLDTGCKVAIDSAVGHTSLVAPGSWADIPAAMRRDVILAVGTFGGNATVDPNFGWIVLEID